MVPHGKRTMASLRVRLFHPIVIHEYRRSSGAFSRQISE